METRPFYVAGDVIANATAGGAASWAAASVVPGAWGMWLGMPVGMILGMLVGTVCGVAFMPLFGALEVMLPTMVGGMFAGMAGGMLSAGQTPFGLEVWQLGIGIGLAAVVFTYGVQLRLGRELT